MSTKKLNTYNYAKSYRYLNDYDYDGYYSYYGTNYNSNRTRAKKDYSICVKVFAYGSCMNEKDFYRSFPKYAKEHVIKLGMATLENYELDFTFWSPTRNGGTLDTVFSSKGKEVLGILYDVPVCLLGYVDFREGHPYSYARENVDVLYNGKTVKAYCYIVHIKNKELVGVAPTYHYAKIVLDGMVENNFPQDYINNYVKLLVEKYKLSIDILLLYDYNGDNKERQKVVKAIVESEEEEYDFNEEYTEYYSDEYTSFYLARDNTWKPLKKSPKQISFEEYEKIERSKGK